MAADKCDPLKLVNQVRLLPSTGGSYREMVPGTVNGVPKLFLLDTGGFISQVSGGHGEGTANARAQQRALHLYDVSGQHSRSFVLADKLVINLVHRAALSHDDPAFQAGFAAISTGFISTDLMLSYDIDIDFGSRA